MTVLTALPLPIVLTVNGQLHHQLVIMGLGSVDLVLHGLLVLVGKHLRALRADFELLKVGLQALDDLTVFLRMHLGQLDTQNMEFSTPAKAKTTTSRDSNVHLPLEDRNNQELLC